jgi:hypothetical protein
MAGSLSILYVKILPFLLGSNVSFFFGGLVFDWDGLGTIWECCLKISLLIEDVFSLPLSVFSLVLIGTRESNYWKACCFQIPFSFQGVV